MSTRRGIAALLIASAGAALLPAAASARAKPRRPDLADAVAGDYEGNVTSDLDGPPKNSVAVTLTRVGPDRVRVTSDYPRIPPVSIGLTRTGGRILNTGGRTSLMFDDGRLELTFGGEVSWDGTKL